MKKNESWIHTHWRPGMAWLYMAICAFDFLIAPVITIILKSKGIDIEVWKPITLAEGGLIHLSFGAICGITAFGRTREKLNVASTETTEEIK
jgi:hypothetical protein